MPWDFWNEYSVCIFVQCFFFNLWVSSHVETCLATEGLCDQAAHLVSLVVLECLGARVESHWANPSDNLDAEKDMVVSWNRGYPKSSSILMGFSIQNQPFWIPPFMETPILLTCSILFLRLLIVMWVTTHQLGSGIRTIWKRCICLTTSSLKLVLLILTIQAAMLGCVKMNSQGLHHSRRWAQSCARQGAAMAAVALHQRKHGHWVWALWALGTPCFQGIFGELWFVIFFDGNPVGKTSTWGFSIRNHQKGGFSRHWGGSKIGLSWVWPSWHGDLVCQCI